jgi:hypothetical protein
VPFDHVSFSTGTFYLGTQEYLKKISSLLWNLHHENISFRSKVIPINALENTCPGFKPSSSGTAAEITSLAQLVAKRLYDSGNGTINAEVTGRTTQIEVNADGTKTMLTGGTKTVYRSPIHTPVLHEKHEKHKEF